MLPSYRINIILVLTTFVIIGLIWLPFIQSQQQIESSNNQTQNNQYVISKPPITRPSSVQVVIDDDNRMKIEEMPKHQVHKQTLDQDNRSSMTSYFIQGDDLTKNETKQLRKPLMNSEFYEPDVNTETNLQSPKPENRYTNFDESVTPSPGTVSEFMEHFMSGDDQSSRVKFDSTDLTDSSETSSYHSSTTKPLVVPVGSRVHTIHYRDYDGNSVHEEQQFVSPLEKYEPKVIELESSRPILPIVINFHTKSSPVIATQTHYKPPNTVPKVQYFETNEPPHYHRHIVHKPIYQNLREIILPYRFLTQEIRPVQEYRQTYVPKWVNRHNRGPQYHSMGSMLSNQFHGNNFKPITPFLQEYRQMGPMSYLRNNRYHFMQQQQQQQKQHSPMSYNNMLNQNPYFKIPNWNKMPYRIQDLYQNHINKF